MERLRLGDVMLNLQIDVVELVVGGEPLENIARHLCIKAEAYFSGSVCSVLRIGEGGRVTLLAAPSLTDDYRTSVEAIPAADFLADLGELREAGDGLAAGHFAQHATPPLFRLCLQVGAKAWQCWPVLGRDQAICGLFIVHWNEKPHLQPAEVQTGSGFARLCALSIERDLRSNVQNQLAYQDVLTGLANRAAFNAVGDDLEKNPLGQPALLIVDLDNLKTINDTFGHKAGDNLIREAAERIQSAAAPRKVFRLGGDEFAVLAWNEDAVQLEALAARIHEQLAYPLECQGQYTVPQASIGGAQGSAGVSLADLYQHADLALYHAKETRRGGFVPYSKDLESTISRRLSAIRDMDAALNDNRIDAYYQPIVRMDTREIVGLEALFRLIRSDGQVMAAGDYFEATTDVGVATRLTARMMDIVASDLRTWRDSGIHFQHIGLNASAADFQDGQLQSALEATLLRHDVPLAHVIVELTEAAYSSRKGDGLIRNVQAMRSGGLRVALDDFGTGMTSLTQLLSSPVDIIKLDKSFVAQLEPGSRSAAIVEGLVHMASKLGMHVVAEGVETEAQSDLLQSFGCLLGQGYLYSRVVHRNVITSLLDESAMTCSQSLDLKSKTWSMGSGSQARPRLVATG